MTAREVERLLADYPHISGKVFDLSREIGLIRDEIDALRTSIPSSHIDGMPHGSGASDPTYRKVQDIVDHHSRRLAKLIDETTALLDTREWLADAIRSLLPVERKVIVSHYIDGVAWDYLPAKLYMSRRACFYAKDQAIQKIARTK